MIVILDVSAAIEILLKKNNHSIYDMFYAVLTRRNDAVLLTNDGALVEVCKILNIETVF